MNKKRTKKTPNVPAKKNATQVEKREKSLPPETTTPEGLLAHAISHGASIEALKELMALRGQIEAERSKKAFFDALAKFQSECPVIVKSKEVRNKKEKGGGLRYRYAPLDVIVSSVKEPLKRNGFSYTVTTKQDENSVTAVVVLHHLEGHHEETSLMVPIDHDAYMTEPQKVASALTYAKRYAFCDATGILTGDEDNDANEIENGGKEFAEQSEASLDELNRKNKETTQGAVELHKQILDQIEKLDKIAHNSAQAVSLIQTADRNLNSNNVEALSALLDSVNRQITGKGGTP